MIRLTSIALLIFSAVASAQPPPDLVATIQKSLQPGITAQVFSEGQSLAGCDLSTVIISGADPILSSPRNVQTWIYSALNKSADAKTILLFPPTFGVNPVDLAYANDLCKINFRVVVMRSWDYDGIENDLGTFDRNAIRALAATEHVLQYLQPTADVGILGTSVGALKSSFIMNYDPRITTGVLIVGGDNMADIVANSQEFTTAFHRYEQMSNYGFTTVDQYYQALKQAIQINPSTFIGFSGAKNVFMSMALDDTAVPTKDQYDLLNAYGNPTHITNQGGHVDTILHTYADERSLVLGFFTENL